jgi:hypothetical protein
MTKSNPRSQPIKYDDIDMSEYNKSRQGKPSFVGASPQEMAKHMQMIERLESMGVCS